MSYPTLRTDTENALYACGRDRVFHNDGQPPSVAIRWTDKPGPWSADEKWIIGRAEGPAEGHDAAGRKAARAFAIKVREHGKALLEWADRIEKALGTP
jgi:hypothetical protein